MGGPKTLIDAFLVGQRAAMEVRAAPAPPSAECAFGPDRRADRDPRRSERRSDIHPCFIRSQRFKPGLEQVIGGWGYV